ncbi:MAG: nucleoside triphosphate pyrophosphohydrolase [Desulfatiglandaceae bacterium]
MTRQKRTALFNEISNAPTHGMDSEKLSKAVLALVQLVARLRSPGGCPWDAAQTDSTLKVYLLEEAYEVVQAVESRSPQDVCLELGDLLFQILFLAQMAAERKEFDFIDVVEKITQKMIHRHPHVFGRARVKDAADVAANWSKIKRAEKGGCREMSAVLKSIPDNLPALLRAHRLSERAAKLNPHFENQGDFSESLRPHLDALADAVDGHDPDGVGRRMGELLFTLVNIMRQWRLNAESILRDFNQSFVERFETMERNLKASGINLDEATAEQFKAAWNNAQDVVRKS